MKTSPGSTSWHNPPPPHQFPGSTSRCKALTHHVPNREEPKPHVPHVNEVFVGDASIVDREQVADRVDMMHACQQMKGFQPHPDVNRWEAPEFVWNTVKG